MGPQESGETMTQPTLHRKKFMGGRMSAEEVHAKLAFPPGCRCNGCGKPPQIRAITMAPLDEVKKRDPDFDQLSALALINAEAAERFYKMCVQIKGSDGKPQTYIRLSTAYACKSCGPAMERALAKGPSWVIVEINRGPGPDKIITSG